MHVEHMPITEQEQVRRAAQEYYDAWFDGDAERMADILHPDLVKRAAGDELRTTTRERMVVLTGDGEGVKEAADRTLDIVVHEVHEHVASARVRSAVYHELLHLVRTPSGWKIASALYVLT